MARITQKQRVKITHCIPKNPFYVTWLNSVGGQGFQMFGIRQTHGISIENLKTFAPNYSEIETTEATISVLSKEVKPYIIASAGQLSQNQLDRILSMKKSILTKWLKDKDNNIWQEVIATPGEYEWDNFSEGFDIKVKFELQPEFIQSR